MRQIESAVNRPSFEAKVIFTVTAGVGGGAGWSWGRVQVGQCPCFRLNPVSLCC